MGVQNSNPTFIHEILVNKIRDRKNIYNVLVRVWADPNNTYLKGPLAQGAIGGRGTYNTWGQEWTANLVRDTNLSRDQTLISVSQGQRFSFMNYCPSKVTRIKTFKPTLEILAHRYWVMYAHFTHIYLSFHATYNDLTVGVCVYTPPPFVRIRRHPSTEVPYSGTTWLVLQFCENIWEFSRTHSELSYIYGHKNIHNFSYKKILNIQVM